MEKYLGCHLSSSDGFEAMGKAALSIGANTFAFFTRNPRGGKAKSIDEADIQALIKLRRIINSESSWHMLHIHLIRARRRKASENLHALAWLMI